MAKVTFRYRQIEMLPEIVPLIANALAQAKLVTISGGEGHGAAGGALQNITSVIQTVLAAQLVSRGGVLAAPDQSDFGNGASTSSR